MRRKKQLTLFFTLVSLLFLSLSCNLPSSLLGNSKRFEDGLVQDYHPAASPVSQYTLSVTQQAYVDEHGYPDRFSIFFFDEILPDGEMFSMRHESWYYDARGYEIVFRNGDKFTERSGAPIQIEGLGHTVYSPQEFTEEMDLDTLLSIRGETGFFAQNVDDDLITGELIFIQGLAAGFEDGRLSYVETLPLSEASSLAEAPSLEEDSGGLTPQELANQGTHTYEVTCTDEDGEEDNWVTGITSEFVEGGVNRTYEDTDQTVFFQKIDVNTYEYLYNGKRESVITFTNSGIQAELSGDTTASCYSLRLEGDSVLTPQELAHQGTHTYEITCTRDGGDPVNYKPHILTFEFVEDGVNWIYEDEEDASFLYEEIGINTYAMFEDGESNTIIFSDLSFSEEFSTGLSCTWLRK